jgi:hypothetical protein
MAQPSSPLPFRPRAHDEHAAAVWLRAGDWAAANEAVARIESWRVSNRGAYRIVARIESWRVSNRGAESRPPLAWNARNTESRGGGRRHEGRPAVGRAPVRAPRARSRAPVEAHRGVGTGTYRPGPVGEHPRVLRGAHALLVRLVRCATAARSRCRCPSRWSGSSSSITPRARRLRKIGMRMRMAMSRASGLSMPLTCRRWTASLARQLHGDQA